MKKQLAILRRLGASQELIESFREVCTINEFGFNRDWIEKCLAHEDGHSSRGVYNKAEYEMQRCHMLQEWADLIDAWSKGEKQAPVLLPSSMEMVAINPAL
jgi:hypothetical protein